MELEEQPQHLRTRRQYMIFKMMILRTARIPLKPTSIVFQAQIQRVRTCLPIPIWYLTTNS